MADGPSARVAKLPKVEHLRAAGVLAHAFHDDPIWRAVFPDPVKRPGTLGSMFGALIKATVAARGMAESTDGTHAVALWLPPGTDIGLRAIMASRLALPRFVMRLEAQDRKRMMAVLSQIGKRRRALVPGPHWYLSAIGADPDHQGNGLGTALVRSGIRRADQDGVPMYLETETSRNVAFYEKLGFEVIEEIRVDGIDVPVWLMIRNGFAVSE